MANFKLREFDARTGDEQTDPSAPPIDFIKGLVNDMVKELTDVERAAVMESIEAIEAIAQKMTDGPGLRPIFAMAVAGSAMSLPLLMVGSKAKKDGKPVRPSMTAVASAITTFGLNSTLRMLDGKNGESNDDE